jgi:hypothetical protein
VQPAAELVTEGTSSRIDFGRSCSDAIRSDCLNRSEHIRQRERITLDDK